MLPVLACCLLTADPVSELRDWQKQPAASRASLEKANFANVSLSKPQALAAKSSLWKARVARLRKERAAEMKANQITIGKHTMKIGGRKFGTPPKGGHSLYISLHGGGGAPPRVNDQQWRNQIILYKPKEGIYIAPRAPTNTWNLWHQGHIDGLFDRLIENSVVLMGVNPDRVYLMGYSAGGDGLYQLAPRMADRFAAASMMAGHPGDASPLSLRNLPFAIHCGERDSAYSRNKRAAEWSKKLAELRKADPQGYVHVAKLHKGKGHWMDRQDAEAVPWMAKFTRNPVPKKIIWKQDDKTHPRFYWLAVSTPKARSQIVAEIKGQTVELTSSDVETVLVRLDDRLLDLDRNVVIRFNGKQVFSGKVPRTIATLHKTLAERGDPQLTFCAEVRVRRPENPVE